MDVRIETYENLKENLKKYGKSALVRSTGFGKTFLLTNLIKEYNKTLYLYPTKVIKNGVEEKYCSDLNLDEVGENVTFMSYMKLIRITDEDFEKMDYDLVICDEVHKVGAEKTSEALKNLMIKLPKAHYVGATATPDRGDAFDVIHEFFNDINVFEFTMHDAFECGLLKRPYYVYSPYNVKQGVENDMFKELKDYEEYTLSSEEKKNLKPKILEISKLYGLDKIVDKVCHECVKDNYLKFICFFSTFKDIEKNKKEIKSWFKKAYPTYKIRELIITSENEVNKANVDKLNEMKREDNTIDLIYCVNMLNMGYHVDDITGIVMYRCTTSSIIYMQQFGRALSSSSKNHSIIFDFKDNIKRASLFDKYDRDTLEETLKERHIREQIEKGNYTGTHIETNNEGKEIELDDEMYYNQETGTIVRKWTRNVNYIESKDLLSVGVKASYREIIKKCVAETMLQRCKIAFTNHFRYWCNENNVPFPISDKEMREVYNLDKNKFNDYFYNLVITNKMEYPLGDAEKLKESGLDLIAKVWNTTADDIVNNLLKEK